ncbi:hypothetical protein KUV46_15220 [Thalassovita mediterranea]|nr:hypothetical protein KUV46_15220 [Thalassovita mediterranea]
MQYVQLQRSFGRPGKQEDDYSYLLYSKQHTGEHSWEDLLKHSKVVVLASAGSGKTEEFKSKAAELQANGSLGLFFAIEELAEIPFEECLRPEQERLFNEWRSEADIGYFFLDSVDEAKLKNPNSFVRALRKLVRALGDHAERAHVYVSCRPSDWNNHTDLRAVSELFETACEPMPEQQPAHLTDDDRDRLLIEPLLKTEDYNGMGDQIIKDNKSEKTKESDHQGTLVVALNPLNQTQQEILARAVLDGDPAQFLSALQLQGLDAFAKRPGDLLELCRFWQKFGKFGSLREMTEHNIRELLKERSHRLDGAALSDEDALNGSKLLALAMVLTKRFTLVAPNHDGASLDKDVADPALVLTDWAPAQRETLLRRGLFAPASFGRVRFQHRSTFEFLAAWSLRDMLRDERTRDKIERLLFPTVFGVTTITPELRPIAAWLAHWDEKIREKIIEVEPIELVRFGDPKSLPLESRKKLLTTLSKKHAIGDVSSTNVDDRAVWAFSATELADAIRQAWKANRHWAFRTLLLDMITQAKIAKLADIASEAVELKADGRALIFGGVHALLALKETSRLQKVASDLICGELTDDDDTAASLCLLLYPKFLSTSDIVTLIKRAQTPKKFTTRGYSWRIVELFRLCPDPDIDVFLEGLSSLALMRPFNEGYERISKQYGYLADHFVEIGQLALDRLDDPKPSSGLINLLLASERSSDRSSLKLFPESLPQRINKLPEIKKALVWADVEETRKRRSEQDLNEHPHIRVPMLVGRRYWSLDLTDEDWLRATTTDPAHSAYVRDTAFHFWLHVLRAGNLLEARKDELKVAAQGNSLRTEWLRQALAPKKQPEWEKEDERRRAAFERKEKKRLGESIAWWRARKKELEARAPIANYSEGVNNESWYFLDHLSAWLALKSNYPKTKAPRTWRALEPVFGERLANLYFNHFKALWRAIPPKRPTWHNNTCTTYTVPAYAFAGIGMEADCNPNWAAGLTVEEAKQAALHLTRADDGAPDWMPALLSAHPQTLLPQLRSELKREWCSHAEWPHSWLNYFANGKGSLPQELADLAISVLVNNAPGRSDRWSYGLRILQRISLTPNQWRRFEKIAAARANDRSASPEERARHLAILCHQNIDACVGAIETTLAVGTPIEAQTVLGLLFDGRHSRSLATDTLAAAHATSLEKLVRMAFKYVRLEDDLPIERSGSVSGRDFAEAARGTLFDALYDNGSQAAYEAIRRFAAEKLVARDEHWFKMLSKRMLEGVASLVAWSEEEVREFADGADLPAKTPSQFFQRIRAAVLSVVSAFESEDATSKKVLLRAAKEDEVRDWLMERLNLQANGRYTCFREAQVHNVKRPDVVVSATTMDSQVAIELKHSDKGWTYNDLCKAIDQQLVGRYLLPENRRSGLLVVSRHKKKFWRHPCDGRRMNFSDLICELKEYAKTVQSGHASTISIDVVGIDCT